MGRQRADPETRTNARLEPPPELTAARRKLWHREFDRAPPGYFVPADVRGMLLYLDWIEIYDRTLRQAKRAKGEAALAWATELRQVAAKVITLQRALRMYPSTRAHPTTAGNMAHDPTRGDAPAAPGEEPWETMMREAGNLN